ncbi:hypothetical protein F4803DRAFT_506162 [Xylaria telfairii]|nr:hypothetical protein F4803DRAFT_506162 [Xylaria telfairii]
MLLGPIAMSRCGWLCASSADGEIQTRGLVVCRSRTTLQCSYGDIYDTGRVLPFFVSLLSLLSHSILNGLAVLFSYAPSLRGDASSQNVDLQHKTSQSASSAKLVVSPVSPSYVLCAYMSCATCAQSRKCHIRMGLLCSSFLSPWQSRMFVC